MVKAATEAEKKRKKNLERKQGLFYKINESTLHISHGCVLWLSLVYI